MLLVVQILIIGSNLFNNVRPTGLEPVTNQLCFTTMTFATLSVCGLDFTFILSDAPRQVSTPSSFDAWLGIRILHPSPTLRS